MWDSTYLQMCSMPAVKLAEKSRPRKLASVPKPVGKRLLVCLLTFVAMPTTKRYPDYWLLAFSSKLAMIGLPVGYSLTASVLKPVAFIHLASYSQLAFATNLARCFLRKCSMLTSGLVLAELLHNCLLLAFATDLARCFLHTCSMLTSGLELIVSGQTFQMLVTSIAVPDGS